MNKPLFSALVPARNAALWIRPCLRSILSQEFEDLEIIVIDDSSSDRTAEIAREELQTVDGRIPYKVLQTQYATGSAAKARNVGLKECSGKYIAFLDSDDIWSPGHLQRAQVALETNLGCRFFCGRGMYQACGKITEYGEWPAPGPIDVREKLLRRAYFPFPSVCISRELLLEVGGVPNKFKCYEDWFLYILVAQETPFFHSADVECIIGTPENSASRGHGTMTPEMLSDALKVCVEIEKIKGVTTREALAAMRHTENWIAKWAANSICGLNGRNLKVLARALLNTRSFELLMPWCRLMTVAVTSVARRGYDKGLKTLNGRSKP